MKPSVYFTCLALCGAPIAAVADVVINEIGAASSERNLRFLEDGRPRLGWGPAWSEIEFDASDWEIGTAPFGFGNDDVATELGEQMIERTPSLYLRKTFTVSAADAAKAEPFRLRAEADSGFVAFVNGHEIARANLGRLNGFVYRDQSTFSSAERNESLSYDSEVLASDVLRAGENVFAVQVQNSIPVQINERDDSIDRSLRFDGRLTLGTGIFGSGSSIPLDLPAEGWQYRVGHAEPSGGVVDWKQVSDPNVDGDFSDWIELHNNGAAAVDLTGWHLTDDEDIPQLWKFPDGTTIPAGGYLVVLADGITNIPGDYIHTSFGLSNNGEFLALSDASGDYVSQFEEGFPRQGPFHSYGLNASGDYVYLAEPSPGAANAGGESSGFVRAPQFEPDGGVFKETVEVTLTSNTEEAVIRYTTDGSEPTPWNGMVYEGPISVEAIDERTGTPIRARAFKDGMIPSRESTQTYLVGVDEVFDSITSMSLVAEDGYAFYAPHGVMTVEGGTGAGNDWRATEAQDYYMPDMHGRAFERKVSMELIYPESGENVQIDGGLRLAASAWSRGRFTLRNTDRSPWQSSPAEKPSFNLFFRNDYGDDTLGFPLVENYPVRRFQQLRLRAGKNDINNPWITDELSRRLYTDMGQFGSRGIQNALWVNGVYKGYFNSVARLRQELLQDFHGGNAQWDVKHIDNWADGDGAEWERTEAILEKDLSVLENYQEALTVVDPVALSDYFLINFYGATWDWPHNNFVIAKERSERGRWRAYMWDAEGMFGIAGGNGRQRYNSITADFRNPRQDPDPSLSVMWKALVESDEFKVTFADRIQKHFFTEGGALTQEHMKMRMNELGDEIRDLMRFGGGGNINLRTIESWIEDREDEIFKRGQHFEPDGLWGDVQTPNFKPSGGGVEAGTVVKISAGSLFDPQGGDWYYTTDGTDPRLPGGEPSPTATLYDSSGPGITIDETMTLKARIRETTLFDPVGTWSAIQEAEFRIGIEIADESNLVITEIMADPADTTEAEDAAGYNRADFEFMEFLNLTESTLDLSELQFTLGIDYRFANGDKATIAPNGYAVIVRNKEAFESRYGAGLPVLGEYDSKLNNGGEVIEIANNAYTPTHQFTYGTEDPWPAEVDGAGKSLVATTTTAGADLSDPANWTASAEINGSPGRAEGTEPPDPPQPGMSFTAWRAEFFPDDASNDAISGVDADPDGDGLTNLAEFGLGSDPTNDRSQGLVGVRIERLEVGGQTANYVVLTSTQREGVDNLTLTLEKSNSLESWEVAGDDYIQLATTAAENGVKLVEWRSAQPFTGQTGYLRWQISMQ